MKKAALLIVLSLSFFFFLAVAIAAWIQPWACPPQRTQFAAALLNRLDTAIEAFFNDTGAYPIELSELLSSDRVGWDGPYIRSGALRDPWDNPVAFAASASGEFYILLSFGADGEPGGEGEYADIVSKNSGPGL